MRKALLVLAFLAGCTAEPTVPKDRDEITAMTTAQIMAVIDTHPQMVILEYAGVAGPVEESCDDTGIVRETHMRCVPYQANLGPGIEKMAWALVSADTKITPGVHIDLYDLQLTDTKVTIALPIRLQKAG